MLARRVPEAVLHGDHPALQHKFAFFWPDILQAHEEEHSSAGSEEAQVLEGVGAPSQHEGSPSSFEKSCMHFITMGFRESIQAIGHTM